MAEPNADASIAPGEPPLPDAETTALLHACMEQHQAGQLAEARAGLEAVLARDPANADELHLLGLVRFGEGHSDEGVALVHRALALAPSFSTAVGNLAAMLRLTARPAEALALLRTSADASPDDPNAARNLGFTLLRDGDAAAAAELFMKVVRLAPEDPAGHVGLGIARLTQQRFHEAEASLRHALGIAPGDPEIHMHLALALRMLGKLDEAIGSLRVALLLRPAYPQALANLGLFLLQAGRVEEAAASLSQAIALEPRLGEAHFALGQILRSQGDADGALASLRMALGTLANPTLAYNTLIGMLTGHRHLGALVEVERVMASRQPTAAAPQLRLARALARAGLLDEAVAAAEACQALQPGSVDALATIASIRYVQGRYDEARAAFGAVLELTPNEPVARATMAMMQLADGDFTQGLPGFEARFDLPQLAAFRTQGSRLPSLSAGSIAQGSVSGKRVLLAAEQGQGDTLHFVRYARQLADRGATVLLEVQAPLVKLLEAMPGIAGVTAQGSPPPQADFTCPMMSLPLAFDTQLDTIPATVPYLAVPAERREAWRAKLGTPTPGRRRVGLCWSGNPGFSADRFRSIPLAQFQPLLADPRLAVHLVQTDIRDGDDAVVSAAPGVVDLRRDLGDFADTAAVIEQLDLVITVDTAVAHLAGALGRPVWILLPYGADWRWLQDRRDSPWYPTARLFRQTTMGDWAPVLAAVRTALNPR